MVPIGRGEKTPSLKAKRSAIEEASFDAAEQKPKGAMMPEYLFATGEPSRCNRRRRYSQYAIGTA